MDIPFGNGKISHNPMKIAMRYTITRNMHGQALYDKIENTRNMIPINISLIARLASTESSIN